MTSTQGSPTVKIPVNEPFIGVREREYVADCMSTGWISSEGAYVHRFEEAWAGYCGVRHGVALSSGTAALFAAVDALRLDPGAEIIMPTFTIISCAHAVLAAGCVPVLVDCEPDTWCMDVGQLADRITPRTAAIMAVHIYGHPADMDPIRELALRHSLAVIEDAAEAHGAEYKGARAGSLGDLACFSFYANKILTTGEGGMVVTNDDELAARVRSYINLAFLGERRFLHKRVGYNHRLTNVQAAIGLAQTEDFGTRVRRKREIGHLYTERLARIDGIELPVERAWAKNVYWMYGLVIGEENGLDAAALSDRLAGLGVDTRPFFLGMHAQPILRDRGLFDGESYPVCDRIARQGLYLPSGLALTDDQIDVVVDRVQDALAHDFST